MPDDKKGRINPALAETETTSARRLGEPKRATAEDLDHLSDDELKEKLRLRGLEVRKQRRPKSPVARPDNVAGKRRITVHLSEELRQAVKSASHAVNRSESAIAEEALAQWMDRNHLRVA